MFQKLTDLPTGIVGLKAVGRVTKHDYETAIEPLLDEARRDERRLRVLCQLGPEFEGLTASAAWKDAKLGLHSLQLIEGCAVMTDKRWVEAPTRLAAFVASFPARVFSNGERAQAVDWLASLPGPSHLSHTLVGDDGVILVKLTGPLRASDFDDLSRTADAWIEAYGALQAIVVHTRVFPGWEDLGSVARHFRFLRDHHKKVQRVAIAADGFLAAVVPRIACHFVKAEVKPFSYSALDAAMAWATARNRPEGGRAAPMDPERPILPASSATDRSGPDTRRPS
jgi:hypothetical protein